MAPDSIAVQHILETAHIALLVAAVALGIALMASAVLWVVSAWWALR